MALFLHFQGCKYAGFRYYRLTALGRKQLEVEVSQFERIMQAIRRAIQTA